MRTEIKPSLNVGAVRAIKKHAPESEWAELFSMLDLVRGDRVAPDDTRPVPIDQLNTMGGKSNLLEGRTERLGDRPKQSTAPESLRVLPPVPVQAAPKKAKARPRVQRELTPCGTESAAKRHVARGEPICDVCTAGRVSRRKPKKEKPNKCGTPAGYQVHVRAHETPCEPCKLATAAKRRERREQQRPACGTPGGARSHAARGEVVCDPCRQAEKVDARRRRAEKAAAEGRELGVRNDTVQCGTESGRTMHYRRGEKPCEPCRAAGIAFKNARKAAA